MQGQWVGEAAQSEVAGAPSVNGSARSPPTSSWRNRVSDKTACTLLICPTDPINMWSIRSYIHRINSVIICPQFTVFTVYTVQTVTQLGLQHSVRPCHSSAPTLTTKVIKISSLSSPYFQVIFKSLKENLSQTTKQNWCGTRGNFQFFPLLRDMRRETSQLRLGFIWQNQIITRKNTSRSNQKK